MWAVFQKLPNMCHILKLYYELIFKHIYFRLETIGIDARSSRCASFPKCLHIGKSSNFQLYNIIRFTFFSTFYEGRKSFIVVPSYRNKLFLGVLLRNSQEQSFSYLQFSSSSSIHCFSKRCWKKCAISLYCRKMSLPLPFCSMQNVVLWWTKISSN